MDCSRSTSRESSGHVEVFNGNTAHLKNNGGNISYVWLSSDKVCT